MVHNMTDIMGVTSSEIEDLDTYQLHDITHTWYKQWKGDRGIDIGLIEWKEFGIAFLDRFFLLELREAKVDEFVNLNYGNISLNEYAPKFQQLSHYAPELVSNMRYRMMKFALGLCRDLVLEYKGVKLNMDMDFSRLSVHIQQVEEEKKRKVNSTLSFRVPSCHFLT